MKAYRRPKPSRRGVTADSSPRDSRDLSLSLLAVVRGELSYAAAYVFEWRAYKTTLATSHHSGEKLKSLAYELRINRATLFAIRLRGRSHRRLFPS